jgi:hypothetical protein
MYTQEAIDVLINRIGWSDLSSGLPFDLSMENLKADSKKKFNWYHPLVLVDNIYAAVPLVNMSKDDFNNYLKEIKSQAVYSALTSILDTHVDYDPTFDYSNVIIGRPSLFDDAIGYRVAISMIELFISTTRSNSEERSAKMSYQALKVELEGAKNDNGHFVAKGIIFKLEKSISKAISVIFPLKIIVKNGNAW